MSTPEKPVVSDDPEFEAMRSVYGALKDLGPEAQNRVLDYAIRRLGLKREIADREESAGSFSPRQLVEELREEPDAAAEPSPETEEEFTGISPIARKWIRRNSLNFAQLSSHFSLGLDSIDLVATSVPGDNKKEKMRSVILLMGAATYLGTGVARVDDEGLRETLSHYNAYDGKNFASYLRDWAPEVSGSKESGYTLSARGLAAAAELIKGGSGSGREKT